MLTLVLTTKNNSELIERQLKYYFLIKLPYKILISDASNIEHHYRNKQVVKEFSDKIKIDYFWQENSSVIESHLFLISKIKTKYSVCVADGAFLVPKTLDKCIRFLEKNKNYVSVQGKVYSFKLENNNLYYGSVSSFFRIKPKISSSLDSIERLKYTCNNYSNCLYSVMHSNVWKEIWSESKNIEFHWISSEILPTLLLVLKGRIGEINKSYLFRHIHNKRTVKDQYNAGLNEIRVDIIKWSGTKDIWNDFCLKFKKILKNKIIEYNNYSSLIGIDKKIDSICDNLFFSNQNKPLIKKNKLALFIFINKLFFLFSKLDSDLIDVEKKYIINFLFKKL